MVASAAPLDAATPASALSTFRTADLGQARSYMSDVFRSHELQQDAREHGLAMCHERLKLGATSFHWLGYGAPITMTAPAMDRFYLFQINLSGHCRIAQGSDGAAVAPGEGYAVDPDRPLSKSWDRDCRQLILRIDRDALLRHAGQELGSDAPLTFDIRPGALAGSAASLIALVTALRADLETGAPSGFLQPRIARHVDATVMALLLDGFRHDRSEALARAGVACAPWYVVRAETYMRASLHEPVTIDEIAAAAGVSARALHNGFRRFRDTTPMAHLKTLRLDLAAEALRRADPQATITEIALACGFLHMSKFARDFRSRFGEAPSALLRRRR